MISNLQSDLKNHPGPRLGDFDYYDTETCGLHGPIVLMQYAHGAGEIMLHEVWREPSAATMQLMTKLLEKTLVGFNHAFDMFHFNQMYNVLARLTPDCEPDVLEYARNEAAARDGVCLKPANALDLLLHARKGPYQSMMEREDVRIKRIPTIMADRLAEELNSRLKFKDIYFSRNPKNKNWKVMDLTDDLGDVIPEFKDLVLSFAPSSALKALAQDALGYEAEDVTFFKDIDVPAEYRPNELGYAPFATAIGNEKDWNFAWPNMIREHIIHWQAVEKAREYARKDVLYTRQLHYFFSCLAAGLSEDIARQIAKADWAGHDYLMHDGKVVPLLPGGDDDSILACSVGAIRWRGYEIDIPALKALKQEALDKQAKAKYNFNSQEVCKKYLREVLSDTEALVMSKNDKISTKGIILEEIAKWKEETICPKCEGMGCESCSEGTIKTDTPHPAAIRAKEILDYRHADKEIGLYDKLLLAGRFHASFNVIGALSGRMSGTDGLNPQGINRAKRVRKSFPLAPPGYQLTGGDFSGFEVCLADAVYGDPDLRKDLLTKRPCKKCKSAPKANCKECNGTGLESTKIHALFGQFLFPPMSYDQIYDTKGLPGDQDKYSRSKNGVFALLYGGEAYTLVSRVGVEEATANNAYQAWVSKYVVWGQERRKIFDAFCSLKQPGGLGTKVEWHEPADYIESMLGFRRYFTLENKVCRELFALAEDPPKEWYKIKLKVTRRDREQTVTGAVRSALFGATFAIQAGNMRAAANHVIQSSGAGFTKKLQCKLWTLQPPGVNRWVVIPMNIHDEIMNPVLPEVVPKIQPIIDEYLAWMKTLVPLADIEWSNELTSWADK